MVGFAMLHPPYWLVKGRDESRPYGDNPRIHWPQAPVFFSSQYSRLSASASQLASMMFSELPTVLH